jgi:hypothetical protein
MAMMFGKINEIVKEANHNVGIADCVIAIPSWYTDPQRRAVMVSTPRSVP